MDKLRMTSPNLTATNIDKIAELFPEVITETLDDEGNTVSEVDFDLLRQARGATNSKLDEHVTRCTTH